MDMFSLLEVEQTLIVITPDLSKIIDQQFLQHIRSKVILHILLKAPPGTKATPLEEFFAGK